MGVRVDKAGGSGIPIRVTVPEDRPIGALVLIHGLGDHAARHRFVAEALAVAGILVVAPELPGHGSASGRRGHIPDIGAVDSAIAAGRELVASRAPDVRCGISGHSMGGLLVTDHFARGLGHGFDWVWLSSALIEPRHGKPKWLQFFGRALSKVWPSWTITSGVCPGDSWEGSGDPELVERERASGTHDRMSVGLGAELMRAGLRVAAAADGLFGDIPVLMTHGDADRVCPMGYATKLFEALPSTDKRFLAIEGARHEPWNEPAVVERIRDWVVERASLS